MLLDRGTRIGVLGAGAMGSGIALVAATAGHDVILVDADANALTRASASVTTSLARDVEKGRLDAAEARAIEGRFRFAEGSRGLSDFRECGLVIEAIIEDLESKRRAFQSIESVVDDSCVLASNTSSLSIAGLGAACKNASRVIGLHFFNPATVLPLVEVIGAIASDPEVIAAAKSLMANWRKVPVVAADTPGFIVNRVARPFYGESLRLYEEGIGDVATIDWAMKELGGFRMGPFELMDLIGNDVNYAVTRSVFEALHYDPRYMPSVVQHRMVEAGRLGRKSGLGYYDYRTGAERPAPRRDLQLGREIMDRVLAMLINGAADAVHMRIATVADVDLAMTKGVNYPKGLLAWADEIGAARVLERLSALQDEYGEDRYRPSPLLKRAAREGRRFHS